MDAAVESPTQMARRVVRAYPQVADSVARASANGTGPDVDLVRTWLAVYGADVRASLDADARVNMLSGDELDAIVEEVTFVCAHLEGGLDDVEFIAEWAMHAAADRRRETMPAGAAPAAEAAAVKARRPVMPMVRAVLAWTPVKARPARARRVRVCADVTDARGRVAVPEDTYGVALDWPMFGPVTVEFPDRYGRPVRVGVSRDVLAVIDR